jgi:hypothetical protein
MSKALARILVSSVFFILLLVVFETSAFAQGTMGTFFTQGNLVVAVNGCGVHGGTCTSVPNGTGTGAGNSSAGGYGDNQAGPLTLFQYSPNGTSSVSFVNSMVLPQAASGANLAVSAEYGSSSEGTLNLSGVGQYLTIMGYGIDALSFNAHPTTYGPADGGALAQSNSLTGQSYTPVPRVVTLIDANGNVNSATSVFNVFNGNNPRSTFTANGTTAYISGQGTSGDATAGVFYIPLGAPVTSPTTITGLDTSSNTASQDTRDVQIVNGTLYVSTDTKGGSGAARSYIGTLGTPPATSVYSCGSGCPSGDGTIGPAQLPGFGSTSGTGKVTLTAVNGNNLNASQKINLSPVNYFFASPTVLYVADSGNPKNDSNGDDCGGKAPNVGDGGLQKWVNVSGTWTLEYTLYEGLNIVSNCGSTGTTGLYGLAGAVSGGSVLLYVTNYTLSDLDTTYLYGITDTLSNTTPPGTSLAFTLLDTAPADSNFKGVSFAPTIPAGSVEVTTVPSGLTFSSSGTGCAPGTYTSPITLSWTPGSSCTLSVASPQAGGTGVQYALSQWEDGTTSTSHVVTAPSTTATYTATFNTQYLLTTSAGTGGSVSAGGYFTADTAASITATPAAGYYFNNFTGTSASSNNPFSLTMNSPQSITANFLAQGSQAITFTTNAPASAPFGSQFTVAATGGASGNSVVFTSAGACTNSGATYTITSPSGTCSVIANQAGNTDYQAAPTVTQTTNATQASTTLSVTSVSPAAEDYGQDATITITAVLSWSGVGTAPTASNLVISGNGPSGSYGTTNCSAPSGNTLTCTNTYTPTNSDVPGAYTESATFSGDTNYTTSSSSQTNNFTINQATTTTTVTSNPNPSSYNQSVTFTATVGGEYGPIKRRKGAPKPPDVSGTVTWSDNTGCGTTPVTTGTPGIATCTTSNLPVGTATISATYSGDTNHSGSSGTLSGGQVVNQASQTITFTTNAPASAAYNSNFTVAATGGASGNPVTFTSAGSCSNSGATYTMTSGTGTCSVIANQAGNTNYADAAQVTQSVNATQLSQTITFTTNAPASAVYNSNFTVAATGGASGNPVTFTSAGSCSNSSATYTMTSGTGACSVIANQAGNSNYAAATQVTQSVNAKQASQSISFSTNAPASAAYGTSFTVAASASSSLPVTYSSSGQCTNSGPTYTITSASGMCNVIANQSGNSNYLAASPVNQSTLTTRANPTVSFTGAPATAPYQSTFTLVATTNSTAAAVITTNNPGTCPLSASSSPSSVTVMKDAGTCKFTASWQADANYNAATATQSTTATKAQSSPTITWSTPASITYGTPLSSTQLDASSTLAGKFTYMPGVGKIEPVGTFTLNTTFQPTNMNYTAGSASTTLQVTQASTTTTITSSSSTVRLNASGMAYVTLDFNVASYKPTGTVTLQANTGETCSATVNAGTGNGGCKLTFSTTGTRTITATYGGDTNHTGSNSSGQTPAVTVTVNPY